MRICSRGTTLLAAAVINATLSASASAAEPGPLTPIEALGKAVFFDARLSRPRSRQACASCHDPARGWVLPDAKVNRTTVVAPGAAPHAIGNIKTPSNAYASFSPPFASTGQIATPFRGGNFWDGRAEGCGATGGKCPVGQGQASATITPADLPPVKRQRYRRYLGPIADQALNPFPNPVEQNIAEMQVCREVQRVRYAGLYHQAFGEKINCATEPESAPPYRAAYKRLAVALAAWQSSSEVNSFSSRRDQALASDPDGHFPLQDLTEQENRGRDLFYGQITLLNPSGKNARCAICHVGVPQGNSPDSAKGEARRELFTDNSFHNIGMPYNREVPGFAAGQRVGLTAHIPNDSRGDFRGFVRTPTLRNVAKGVGDGFVRAYGHNGWFKSLAGIVHFYNTRDKLPKCESFGLTSATEAEARARNCWPKSEFPNQTVGVFGNLALDADEEAALVAFLETLSDEYTPRAP